ncbi:hypothetical protein, partial [Mesomycoplasma hyorhinis]
NLSDFYFYYLEVCFSVFSSKVSSKSSKSSSISDNNFSVLGIMFLALERDSLTLNLEFFTNSKSYFEKWDCFFELDFKIWILVSLSGSEDSTYHLPSFLFTPTFWCI